MEKNYIIILLVFIIFIVLLKINESFTVSGTQNNSENSQVEPEVNEIYDENTEIRNKIEINNKVREIKKTIDNNIYNGISGNLYDNIDISNIPSQISQEKISKIEELMYNECFNLDDIKINNFDNNTNCYSSANECHVLDNLDLTSNMSDIQKMTSIINCKEYFKDISIGGNCENNTNENLELRKMCIPEHIIDDYYLLNYKLINKSLSDFFIKLPKTFLSGCFIEGNRQTNFVTEEDILVYDAMIRIVFDLQSCYGFTQSVDLDINNQNKQDIKFISEIKIDYSELKDYPEHQHENIGNTSYILDLDKFNYFIKNKKPVNPQQYDIINNKPLQMTLEEARIRAFQYKKYNCDGFYYNQNSEIVISFNSIEYKLYNIYFIRIINNNLKEENDDIKFEFINRNIYPNIDSIRPDGNIIYGLDKDLLTSNYISDIKFPPLLETQDVSYIYLDIEETDYKIKVLNIDNLDIKHLQVNRDITSNTDIYSKFVNFQYIYNDESPNIKICNIIFSYENILNGKNKIKIINEDNNKEKIISINMNDYGNEIIIEKLEENDSTLENGLYSIHFNFDEFSILFPFVTTTCESNNENKLLIIPETKEEIIKLYPEYIRVETNCNLDSKVEGKKQNVLINGFYKLRNILSNNLPEYERKYDLDNNVMLSVYNVGT